ncbi:MAG: FAD-dependent oxidoreductase [Pirellulales bacterium]
MNIDSNQPSAGTNNRRLRSAAAVLLWASLLAPRLCAAENYDIVVYGGTAGGVTAAIEAARLGKSVAIIEPSQHLGGMTTGGLSATDYGNKLAIRGLAREFYTRVGQVYNQGTTYWFEPKVGESVINQWVASLPNITVVKGERLNLNSGVTKTGSLINSIQMESGRTFNAAVFIDASYEGDLMAKSGVSYIVGRESSSTYNEPHAGVFVNTQTLNVDPYIVPGNPASGVLPMLSAQLPPANGTADDKVQAYNFRLTVTTNANRLPWTAPPNYDPARYELLKRAIQATSPTSITQLLQLQGLNTPNGANKWDVNANGNLTMVSTDYVGFSKNYPDADYATRQQIIADHRNYEQGYLYFLATDPSIPVAVRNGMNNYGLAPDEFTDNGNWPTQLYVREARRMIGRYVMTEADDLSQRAAGDPIALGSYTIDSHATSFFVDAIGKPHAEGNIGISTPQPFGISYRSLTPQESQVSNLLVSSAISASRVGYGSIRMEPQYMMMGQAAGAAAALALNGNTSVQQVNYSALRTQLLADGARVTWPMSLVGAARADFNDIPGALPRSIQFQNSGTNFFGPWDFTTTQNVVAGNLTTSVGGYNRPQTGSNAGKIVGTYNAYRQSGCPLDAPMSGTVWFSVLVNNTDATGVAGISFNPTSFSDSANAIELVGTTLRVTLANTTTNNVATLNLNNVHLLLGRLTITAGNDTLSLWADPASIANLSAPTFTNSSVNFLSSLSSLGIISYNTSKSNAGGYVDALIASNSATASIDVTGVSIAGDFNLDGVVDAVDYTVWRKALGTAYSQSDYEVWRANFGRAVVNGTGTTAFAAIPEPAVLILLITAVALWCTSRH